MYVREFFKVVLGFQNILIFGQHPVSSHPGILSASELLIKGLTLLSVSSKFPNQGWFFFPFLICKSDCLPTFAIHTSKHIWLYIKTLHILFPAQACIQTPQILDKDYQNSCLSWPHRQTASLHDSNNPSFLASPLMILKPTNSACPVHRGKHVALPDRKLSYFSLFRPKTVLPDMHVDISH